MQANHSPDAPIGVFDSGIGGLTVAHALLHQLPNEQLIYFGDTAHMPYGDKSTAAIQAYSIKIAHMLLQQGCKLILIACNTASAAAYELVKEYVGSKALVMNVIDPIVRSLSVNHADKKIGLIGTRQTVNSHIYKKKMDALNANIHLVSHATNLLAQAIEEFGPHPIIDQLLNEYLSHDALQGIDGLVLACTHYPVIKKQIAAYYDNNIEIIDASLAVAEAVKMQLQKHVLLNESKGLKERRFYLSDYTESFASNAKLFFSEPLILESYPLWD